MLSTNNISGGGGASLSDATPAPLGVAAPGTNSGASHADHVHAAPLSTDITDSSAVGQAVLTAANAPNARTALGVYSAAEVDAAIASVGSGTSHTAGTLAALPAAPGAGDTYAVTTGFARGDRYRCYVATVWEPLTEYYDFSGATGWTAQANAGAASITSGIARLSTAVDPSVRTDAGGYTYNAPALTRALPAWVSSLDVMVRISSMSLAATSFAHLEISDAISGGNRRSVVVNQAGTLVFYNNTANSTIVGWGSVFGSYTGQEWLRLVQADGELTAYTGVGVGGQLPKSWTSRGSVSIATAWTHVALSMQSYSGVGTRTIEFDDLLIRWGD